MTSYGGQINKDIHHKLKLYVKRWMCTLYLFLIFLIKQNILKESCQETLLSGE